MSIDCGPHFLMNFALQAPLIHKVRVLSRGMDIFALPTGWLGAVALCVHGQQSRCCAAIDGQRR